MNGVLAIAGFTALYMVGLRHRAVLSDPPVIGEVAPASPAAAAGFRPGARSWPSTAAPKANWEEADGIVSGPIAASDPRAPGRGENEFVVQTSTNDSQRTGQSGGAPGAIGRCCPEARRSGAGLKPDDGILGVNGKR